MKKETAPRTVRTLPPCRVDGRPRFLAPLDCGGVVVVQLLDESTAYVRTPDLSDDLGDLDALGVPTANGVAYPQASGHFRLAAGEWAVDRDGWRDRLSVSRGGFQGEATPAGRRKVGESMARALREVVAAVPGSLESARVADLRADRERALDDAREAAQALGMAFARLDALDVALGQNGRGPRPVVRLDACGRPHVVEAEVEGVAEVVRAARAFVVAADDLLADPSGEHWGALNREAGRLASAARERSGVRGRKSRHLLDVSREACAFVEADGFEALREHVRRLESALAPFDAVES